MLRLLNDGDKETILLYLKAHEIETSFLYANVLQFGIGNRKAYRRCGDYYGYFDGESLRGILPIYNLGSCIPHFEDPDAVPFFTELMRKREFEVLMGMRRIIEPLYRGIKDCKEVQSVDQSSYFINRSFRPFKLDGIDFINADKEADGETIDFVLESRIKGFNQHASREDVEESFAEKGKEEEYIIARRGSKMVSAACVQTYTQSINQIGSVYTAESERGKGCCKAVVSEMCGRIIAGGKTPTLMVRKNNTPAVRAYTALGFVPYDDYLMIKFK